MAGPSGRPRAASHTPAPFERSASRLAAGLGRRHRGATRPSRWRPRAQPQREWKRRAARSRGGGGKGKGARRRGGDSPFPPLPLRRSAVGPSPPEGGGRRPAPSLTAAAGAVERRSPVPTSARASAPGAARVLPGPALLFGAPEPPSVSGGRGARHGPSRRRTRPSPFAPSPAGRRPAVGPSRIRWPDGLSGGGRGFAGRPSGPAGGGSCRGPSRTGGEEGGFRLRAKFPAPGRAAPGAAEENSGGRAFRVAPRGERACVSRRRAALRRRCGPRSVGAAASRPGVREVLGLPGRASPRWRGGPSRDGPLGRSAGLLRETSGPEKDGGGGGGGRRARPRRWTLPRRWRRGRHPGGAIEVVSLTPGSGT